MSRSNEVTLYEVGPRDGLQNESITLLLDDKLEFIRGLFKSGLRELEVGSFVRADRVPQMADTDQLCARLGETREFEKAHFWTLVPNLKGLERALECGQSQVAVFTAVSETFNQKNIGMSITESLEQIRIVLAEAKRKRIKVRAYLSTAFGCPFEGAIPAKNTLKLVERLLDLGATQVSIGDTIGVATPKQVLHVAQPAVKRFGAKKIALHFHDTRGTALANALRGLDLGVRNFDSSAGGLGGCPYAPGATGNLATEDLVYLLHGLGLHTGVNLQALCQASLALHRKLNRSFSSRYLQSFAAQCK